MSIRPEKWAHVADRDLSGRRVLVTGSTDGIGREAALAMGRLGATVLVHGRSEDKADRVVDRIESAGGTAHAYTADFASLERVADLAETIRSDVDRIDVLANNAGTFFREAHTTDAGVEATLTVNHLAAFLLTHRLLDLIPEDGRIVTTASGAHKGADPDLDLAPEPSEPPDSDRSDAPDSDRSDAADSDRSDPDWFGGTAEYDGFSAYSRSKLANILFARELARRLDERTSNCFHPGFIPGSALWRHTAFPLSSVLKVLGVLPNVLTRHVIDTPATGAATLVYLVASGEVEDVTGEYFEDCEPREPSPTARDDELGRQLWEWSARRVGLEPHEQL